MILRGLTTSFSQGLGLQTKHIKHQMHYTIHIVLWILGTNLGPCTPMSNTSQIELVHQQLFVYNFNEDLMRKWGMLLSILQTTSYIPLYFLSSSQISQVEERAVSCICFLSLYM